MVDTIKRLKGLSLQVKELTEVEMRELIYYFLQLNGANVPQVMTAKINDMPKFYRHVDICKNYFKCFIFDE